MSHILKGRAAAEPVLRMLVNVLRGGTVVRHVEISSSSKGRTSISPPDRDEEHFTRYTVDVPHEAPPVSEGEWFAACELLGGYLMEAAHRIDRGKTTAAVEFGNLQLRAEAELVKMTEAMLKVRSIADLGLQGRGARAREGAIPLTVISDISTVALGEAVDTVSSIMTGTRAETMIVDDPDDWRLPRSGSRPLVPTLAQVHRMLDNLAVSRPHPPDLVTAQYRLDAELREQGHTRIGDYHVRPLPGERLATANAVAAARHAEHIERTPVSPQYGDTITTTTTTSFDDGEEISSTVTTDTRDGPIGIGPHVIPPNHPVFRAIENAVRTAIGLGESIEQAAERVRAVAGYQEMTSAEGIAIAHRMQGRIDRRSTPRPG